ncbi:MULTISPECIES: asparagine synthase (glutamine-hydrolyzing) [Acidobacteriaceae]|uniref:asparagine synthase (glutamine-hydrolyzing) n=1 Tax=Acidobacteriaceae TaxID=204434 RepID=UPI00211076FF|nr:MULTISPECIES: asparagine synthase (glutamine-hydrolyzing) [Acidobacteriaceae]MDW5265948.1 asparagine synthase (glutamine-hydrolyzing) [Edaphobacter sp.]
MCGIFGVFNRNGGPVAPELIQRMGSVLQHRGPDGEGRYISNEIGLGHRRLSIIDVAGGSQPIANEDGTLHIIFNGEIYNYIELREELLKAGHIFKTRSDTEVILHGYEEWGTACVERFNGIFAFAIWSGINKSLFLARDHLGVKPLYYAVLGHRILFASEIKALLQDQECPREVDLEALSQLFTLRYVPSPKTLFSGIYKLPPAHWMLVNSKKIEFRRFWTWKPSIREHCNESELIETYQDLVEDAVRLQMRSDVPVGLFLSSGVDSATLLALMRHHTNGRIHTFTLGFEHGEQSSETRDARGLAELYGADHTELVIGPKDYQDYYRRYLMDLEEPVGNETAAAFYFVSQMASKKVKVALTGQGADEPWAGYPRYIGASLSGAYSRLPRAFTANIVRPVVLGTVKNERLRRGVNSLSEPDMLSRFVKMYSFYTNEMKSHLFQPWLLQHISTDGVEAENALRHLQQDVSELDAVNQMTYIDTRANLPDDLLMVADKTSMANSVEARVPFLDHRVVEFAESLPSNFKLRHLRGKYLHKKAAEKWLPLNVVYRKKKGFANPIDCWLREQMKSFVGDCLLSDASVSARYFDKEYIRSLVADHETGRQNHLRHIYLLISFELWHRQFMGT